MVYTNWQFPSHENLVHEYQREWLDKNVNKIYGDFYKSAEEFILSCQFSSFETINRERDNRMANRSHTKTKEQLINMIKHFRSYPKFRNEQTIENLYFRFANNLEMDMPIVVADERGNERILGGNTRMDVAFQLGIQPKAIILKV